MDTTVDIEDDSNLDEARSTAGAEGKVAGAWEAPFTEHYDGA